MGARTQPLPADGRSPARKRETHMTEVRSFCVASSVDAIWCSREASRFAAEIGFTGNDLAEIAIVVSELVSNVSKFAMRGQVTMEAIGEPRRGIRIVVADDGPGIEDIDSAMLDGFSEGRMLCDDEIRHDGQGLGSGLGAVERLTDELFLENLEEGGLRVTAIKHVPRPRRR